MIKLNSINLGDCVTVMKSIPDNSVDLSVVDPPFNLNKKYSLYDDKLQEYEYMDWSKRWLAEMVRVTKPTGSIIIHNIPKWLYKYANYLDSFAYFRDWISWEAGGQPLGSDLMKTHYGFLWYSKSEDYKFYDLRVPHKRCRKCKYLLKDWGGKKNKLHPFGTIASDVWTDIHRVKSHSKRVDHPCILPLHLIDRIILMTTDENDVVLDCMFGSGTALVSAKQLGRQYIGIELDSEYIQIATDRIKDTTLFKIGQSWVSFYLGKLLTIRDKDWEDINKHYVIPDNIKDIDFTEIIRRIDG